MKKLFSTDYSSQGFNIAMLIFRIGLGGLMAPHGYQKLQNFSSMKAQFLDFMGLGPAISLGLTIFAEFFCSILVIIGLTTRLATIPPIIAMWVALVIAHDKDLFGKGEHAALYILGFLVILILGPGKASVDGMLKR